MLIGRKHRHFGWIGLGLLTLLAILTTSQGFFAQSPAPQTVTEPITLRPLPGSLDRVPVFNSNSPEVVQTEGILLSTFPSQGMQVPSAHLNFPLQGRFDLFLHHIARAPQPAAGQAPDLRTLYVGMILNNPGQAPVTVNVLQAASYLSQPDAPFLPLPDLQTNDDGSIFAGPGDRVASDFLRGKRQAGWPNQIILAPGESQMLVNLPIPVRTLTPPLNGRSTLIRLWSSGPVYGASLGMFAKPDANGAEQAPSLADWQNLLKTSGVAGPRDLAPTPLNTTGRFIYGRVAGVARGSRWRAQVTDPGSPDRLQIPATGQGFGYGISTLVRGRLGTEQVQTAPMLVRYPDTALQAHGNYAIEYDLSLPLFNPTDRPQKVTLSLQTPVKFDQPAAPLRFLNPPPNQVFFRGSLRLRYRDDGGTPVSQYLHLVQRRGQASAPLITLQLAPQATRLVQVNLVYPPDATPPQVLTIKTLP